MKSVELKKVKFSPFGQEMELDYKALLQVILEAPANPQKGADITEVRRCLRVLDVLETAESVLTLEDADYDFLKNRVETTKFSSNSRAFVEFVEAFQ